MQAKKNKLTLKDISQIIASIVFIASIITFFIIIGAFEDSTISFSAFLIGSLTTLAVMFFSALAAGLVWEGEKP